MFRFAAIPFLIVALSVGCTADDNAVRLAATAAPDSGAEEFTCDADLAKEGNTFAGQKGRFESPENAIEDHASKSLVNGKNSYDKLEKKSDKQYLAKKRGKLVAKYSIVLMPEGGYEVQGVTLCSTDLRPDTDSP